MTTEVHQLRLDMGQQSQAPVSVSDGAVHLAVDTPVTAPTRCDLCYRPVAVTVRYAKWEVCQECREKYA